VQVGCAGLFHERASGGAGVNALLFAGCWFGISWAWASWWGVAFLAAAAAAYFLLALVLQVHWVRVRVREHCARPGLQ
jgi:hypothetical protein